ncbi:hypothetical protein [Humibacter sp.]|uniref:hypothetical protein n=1 Tax=Humibacter sp. TaxID=1940291 RepID=UPI002CA64F48|nr:hypothetical protein [Humibacter sp.]HVX09207.1 hypothetical protein [Humibacter sp.]
MIIDAIVTVVLGILTAVLSIVPSMGTPSWPGPATTLGAQTAAFNNYLPLTDGMAMLTFALTIRIGTGVWRLALWVYHQIHGGQ